MVGPQRSRHKWTEPRAVHEMVEITLRILVEAARCRGPGAGDDIRLLEAAHALGTGF